MILVRFRKPSGHPLIRSTVCSLYYVCLQVWLHNANMSVQYTEIFHGCKNDNFQMIFFYIFLIFAQNIDCGYTLEPPHENPQSMF